jgi:hypothetical protein
MTDGANGRTRAGDPVESVGTDEPVESVHLVEPVESVGSVESVEFIDSVEPTMTDLLDDLAADFPDVQRRSGPAGVEFVTGEMAFAAVAGDGAQFRLRPEIVAAAVRTSDAAVSSRGRAWVSFRPRRLDQYALDRAQAWFELGHRLAAEGDRASKQN